jgi:hypothetical protein
MSTHSKAKIKFKQRQRRRQRRTRLQKKGFNPGDFYFGKYFVGKNKTA